MGLSKAVPAAFPSGCIPSSGRSKHPVPLSLVCLARQRNGQGAVPAAFLDSALARQSSGKSQERSSTAGDFHHLLLHIDFFFTLQNVIIALG